MENFIVNDPFGNPAVIGVTWMGKKWVRSNGHHTEEMGPFEMVSQAKWDSIMAQKPEPLRQDLKELSRGQLMVKLTVEEKLTMIVGAVFPAFEECNIRELDKSDLFRGKKRGWIIKGYGNLRFLFYILDNGEWDYYLMDKGETIGPIVRQFRKIEALLLEAGLTT